MPSLQSVAIVTGGVEGWACEVPSLQPMGDLGDLATPRLQSEVKSSIEGPGFSEVHDSRTSSSPFHFALFWVILDSKTVKRSRKINSDYKK